MQSNAATVTTYLLELPPPRAAVVRKLRSVIKRNLPAGFVEQMQWGMPGFVVPLSRYPAGYNNQPAVPLPFVSYASQVNSVNLYHMGLYADAALLAWFQREWQARDLGRLDMGKSCIRFAKLEAIPYDLIGELVSKVTVARWVALYEQAHGKPAKSAKSAKPAKAAKAAKPAKPAKASAPARARRQVSARV